MANGVPREVPRPKPEGPPALRVFWPRDFPSDSIHHDSPKAFHTFSNFRHPGLVKRDFFQPMDSLGSIMVNICS